MPEIILFVIVKTITSGIILKAMQIIEEITLFRAVDFFSVFGRIKVFANKREDFKVICVQDSPELFYKFRFLFLQFFHRE